MMAIRLVVMDVLNPVRLRLDLYVMGVHSIRRIFALRFVVMEELLVMKYVMMEMCMVEMVAMSTV